MRTIPSCEISSGRFLVMSAPLSITVPASGGIAPVIRLNTVVLPAPSGPTSAVTSPRRSDMSRPFTARIPPKVLASPWTSSTMSLSPAPGRRA